MSHRFLVTTRMGTVSLDTKEQADDRVLFCWPDAVEVVIWPGKLWAWWPTPKSRDIGDPMDAVASVRRT